MSLEDAVDHTLDEMPEDFCIREFLIANRAEVKNMCLTEYNEAETMQMFKDEERYDAISRMLRSGKTAEAIADFCGYPIEQVKAVEKELLVSAD